MAHVAAEATSDEVFDYEEEDEREGNEAERLDPAWCRRR